LVGDCKVGLSSRPDCVVIRAAIGVSRDAVHLSTAAKVIEGLRAERGDRIVIRQHSVDDRVRDGEIIEVRGPDGAPPFVVRWSEDGRVSTFFPRLGRVRRAFPLSDGPSHQLTSR
jgi:hypothetical protein